MFNSAMSTTPSDSTGLTALAIWILSCIVFVFVALLFYVFILVNMKRLEKKIKSNIHLSQDSSMMVDLSDETDSKSSFDLDLIFLVVHLVTYAMFIIIYLTIFLI